MYHVASGPVFHGRTRRDRTTIEVCVWEKERERERERRREEADCASCAPLGALSANVRTYNNIESSKRRRRRPKRWQIERKRERKRRRRERVCVCVCVCVHEVSRSFFTTIQFNMVLEDRARMQTAMLETPIITRRILRRHGTCIDYLASRRGTHNPSYPPRSFCSPSSIFFFLSFFLLSLHFLGFLFSFLRRITFEQSWHGLAGGWLDLEQFIL